MNEPQRLFLAQARSDYAVFELLRGRPGLPHCHALHYIQMATELLGKSYAWRRGQPASRHRAFVGFLRSLSTNRQVRRQLGFEGRNESWVHQIRKSMPLAERIEDLAPSLTPDGPNPEYPWPRESPQSAPVEHVFEIWQELEETTAGHHFLRLTGQLFQFAESFL